MDEMQYGLNTYGQIKRQGYPECSCGLGINKTEHYELKCKAYSWRALFFNAKKREDSLKQDLAEQSLTLKSQITTFKSQITILQEELDSAKAQIQQYKHMVFGKKSEKSKATGALAHKMKPGKKRGQQKGQKGHGRTILDLPIKEEIVELKHKQTCRRCWLPYSPMNVTNDSEVVEISVNAYKRVIKRMKYTRHPNCKCYCAPKFVTAPMPPKCIPKGKFGSSIYANLLVGKFGYQIPLYRLIKQFSLYDINLSPGTVTGGFKTLLPLLEPVYDAIVAYSQTDKHWHIDETGWKVFKKIKDKKTYNWFLWVFCNAKSSVYTLAPGRGLNVPQEFFNGVSDGGIISTDRYAVYNRLAINNNLQNSYCWIHVRRDFINLASSHPKLKCWALSWVRIINKLLYINKQRVELYNKKWPFYPKQEELEAQLQLIERKCREQVHSRDLHIDGIKALRRLQKFWRGLTTFELRPKIPISNNTAGSALCGPVVGRKNYYGSGSRWSAKLTAIMFSIVETLKKWNINPIQWLTKYLDECAKYGNKAPWWVVNDSLPWDIPDTGFRLPIFI